MLPYFLLLLGSGGDVAIVPKRNRLHTVHRRFQKAANFLSVLAILFVDDPRYELQRFKRIPITETLGVVSEQNLRKVTYSTKEDKVRIEPRDDGDLPTPRARTHVWDAIHPDAAADRNTTARSASQPREVRKYGQQKPAALPSGGLGGDEGWVYTKQQGGFYLGPPGKVCAMYYFD